MRGFRFLAGLLVAITVVSCCPEPPWQSGRTTGMAVVCAAHGDVEFLNGDQWQRLLPKRLLLFGNPSQNRLEFICRSRCQWTDLHGPG